MAVTEETLDNIRTLGTRLRAARARRKLSLADLAAKAQVSKSLISQIERDVARPSIDTLRQIASALEVPVFSFFLDEARTQTVVRSGQRRAIVYPGSRVVREILSPGLNGRMVLLWVTFPPGEGTPSPPGHHVGEESVVVIQGVVEVVMGEEIVRLEGGDSMSFDSQLPHGFRNPTEEVSQAIVAISPPHL